jgi:NADPH2:quinone reductase
VSKRLVARVLDELTTTFAIPYTGEIKLDDLLDPEILRRASAKATGVKFLIRPDL